MREKSCAHHNWCFAQEYLSRVDVQSQVMLMQLKSMNIIDVLPSADSNLFFHMLYILTLQASVLNLMRSDLCCVDGSSLCLYSTVSTAPV